MTTEDAKTYLCKREIPQLFECLMTGLMYHRPREHITYLQECLNRIEKQGLASVRWNLFIEQRKKTPLPPITPEDNKRRSNRHTPDKRSSRASSREKSDASRHSPLPPIVAPEYVRKSTQIQLPDVPIVLVMGGPGSGKGKQCTRLLDRYPSVIHISMGDLLRSHASQNATGTTRWGMVNDILTKGEMAPQEMTNEVLCEELQKYPDAGGYLIEGYPRTMDQITDYDDKIGRIDAVLLLDCEEYVLQSRLVERSRDNKRLDDNLNAIASRIAFFKRNTLPVIKKYDDMGLLAVIEGAKENKEITKMLQSYCDPIFPTKGRRSPRPPSSRKSSGRKSRHSEKHSRAGSEKPSRESSAHSSPGRSPSPEPVTVIDDVTLMYEDDGRQSDLPQCPIILVCGGPGSGKGTQCKKLVERYEGFAHISMGDVLREEVLGKGSSDDKWGAIGQILQKGEMAPEDVTEDLLKTALRKHADAKGIFLEGYPRDENQLNTFNRFVGGVHIALVLDCDEYYLKQRLISRQHESGRIDDNLNAISSRISFFKNKTLSVIKHYDEMGKLVVVNGDRDTDEILFDLCQLVDFTFFSPPEREEEEEQNQQEAETADETTVAVAIAGDVDAETAETVEPDVDNAQAEDQENEQEENAEQEEAVDDDKQDEEQAMDDLADAANAPEQQQDDGAEEGGEEAPAEDPVEDTAEDATEAPAEDPTEAPAEAEDNVEEDEVEAESAPITGDNDGNPQTEEQVNET